MKAGRCDNPLNNMTLTHVIAPGWLQAACLIALCACGIVRADETPVLFSHVEGRVMIRKATSSRVEFPEAGRALEPGEIVITGDRACAELREGESGLWRVGRRAVLVAQPGGGRLTAGAALVRVPVDSGWRVESERGVVKLGRGLWMVQAVDNEGLKLVCLDGPADVEACGEGVAGPADAEERPRVKLRPGELVFLKPGGRQFGPVVTIYLEELLATSRLVNGFPEPLAEVRRLRNLGWIQREQLKGVTTALVSGARDDDGFDVVVPKASQ